jgi:alkylation response protein AidB-like acyl-CoA dehydrogenase
MDGPWLTSIPADPELDADLTQFQATLRRLLERHGSPTWSLDQPSEPDPHLWTLLAQQVGVAGLAVPERLGGSGFGYTECHLVLTELGRAAVATPFLASSVLATQALLLAGTERARADLLPALATGTQTATLLLSTEIPLTATHHPQPLRDVPHPDGRAVPPARIPGIRGVSQAPDTWLITGRAQHVLDGASADLLLAFAEPCSQPGQPALFLLNPTHPGLRRTRSPTMDQSLHLAEVECQAVPAHRLSPTNGYENAPARLGDLAATAITADQIGGARRCLELTVEYTKQRVQFGRPIGSFQAIKHRLADLLVQVESAHSASWAAAQAWADNADDAPMLAALAKSYCSETYRAVTAEMIQLHGGLGFTWEHPAHRYFKRAHATATLFGTPTHHRRHLAEHLGLPAVLQRSHPT